MSAKIEEPGTKYGRWTVGVSAGRDKSRGYLWSCLCDCGTRRNVKGADLRAGRSVSCGCLQAERASIANTTHGWSQTPTYRTWRGMLGRCQDPRNASYDAYSKAGITVCSRWESFVAFLADMGERPPGLTLDREDNLRGYSPDNCRWATPKEQQNNTRANRRYEAFGRSLTASEWSDCFGVPYGTIKARFRQGWTVEDAVARPVATKAKRGIKAFHGIEVVEV